jgi:hypothetical protein
MLAGQPLGSRRTAEFGFLPGRVVGVLFENSDHDVLYVAVLMQQFVYVRCGRVDAFVAAQVAAI